MEDKIESLTALFLKNTMSHMRIKTANEAISNFENNILDEIEEIFIYIEELQVKDLDKSIYPMKSWTKFKNSKWAYECLTELKNIKKNINDTPISREFIEDVKIYHKIDWPEKVDSLKYKFSESYYKKYKDYKKYNQLSLTKIRMLSEGFIVLFFKKNKSFYKSYIEWIKNVENLFCLKEGDKSIYFQYSQDEFYTLQSSVNSYNDLNAFDQESFLNFIVDIFGILDDISRSRINNYDKTDEHRIRNEIRDFYHNILDIPAYTTGIMQSDIDNVLWLAINDTVDCYNFLRKKKKLTWNKCKQNNGFKAFMSHRLFIHLLKKETNEFLSEWVKVQITNIKNNYGVYINEKAQIKNNVWIDEHCHIGKCSIDEECHIKNSFIDDDVKIFPRVILNGVKLEHGSVIGPDINIQGILSMPTCTGKIVSE